MKTPPRKVDMPGALYFDPRVSLLDHRVVAHIVSHLGNNGWLKATPKEIGAALGRSRESAHQRLVKLCTWRYIERRGEAGNWEWRVKLDPDDLQVAEAVTASPEREKPNKINAGENITTLVTASPNGEEITTKVNAQVTSSPSGDSVTSPPTPPSKTPSSTESPSPTVEGEILSPIDEKPIDRLWPICTPQMKSRSTKAKAGTELAKRLKAGIALERIIGAIRRYLALDPDVHRSGGPGLHLWLRDRLENWLDDELADELQRSELRASFDAAAWNAKGTRQGFGGRAGAALRVAAAGPPQDVRGRDYAQCRRRDD